MLALVIAVFAPLEALLLSWRYVCCLEVPPVGAPPVYAIRPGLDPTRKNKGRYPSEFA